MGDKKGGFNTKGLNLSGGCLVFKQHKAVIFTDGGSFGELEK